MARMVKHGVRLRCELSQKRCLMVLDVYCLAAKDDHYYGKIKYSDVLSSIPNGGLPRTSTRVIYVIRVFFLVNFFVSDRKSKKNKYVTFLRRATL